MLAIRLALAAVFLVSGIAKAIAPRTTSAAARDLGVPAALAAVTAVLLPLAEIAVAALLIPTPSAAVGSAIAIGLLVAFTAVVAGNLARGRRPTCACFGELSADKAISGRTLARNGVLLAASVTVFVATLLPGACAAGCYDAAGGRQLLIGGGAVLLIAVAAGLLLIHSLTTMVGQLGQRVRDLEAVLGRSGPVTESGSGARAGGRVDVPALLRAAADGTVTDPEGSSHRLADLVGSADRTLLLFLSSHCSACTRVRAHVEAVTGNAGVQFVGIMDTWDPTNPPTPGGLALYADAGVVAEAGGIRAFPSAVEVDAGLHPSGPVLTGSIEIRRYLDAHQGVLQRV